MISRGSLVFWIVMIAVTVGIVTVAFVRLQPPPSVDPATIPRAVDILTLRPRPVDITYATRGTVEARNRIDMNVEVPGTIVAIAFTEGQPVQKGQVLMRLRADRQSAQQWEASAGLLSSENFLLGRQADVGRAEADLAAARATQALAESEYQRYQKLREEDYISALELDQKQAAFQQESARTQAFEKAVAVAKAQLRQAQSQMTESKARLAYNRAVSDEALIRAPFDGLVGQKYVDIGDYVLPTEKLLTLVDNREMTLAFTVPEAYLSRLQQDDIVRVALEGQAGRLVSGRVFFIDPAVNPENRTVAVKALLAPEKGMTLRDGQFGEVRLVLETKGQGLVVPEQALVPQGEKFFVYRVQARQGEGSRVAFHEVQLGQRETGWAEVISGLKPGDRIVTSGIQKLFDGAPILEGAALKRSSEAGPR